MHFLCILCVLWKGSHQISFILLIYYLVELFNIYFCVLIYAQSGTRVFTTRKSQTLWNKREPQGQLKSFPVGILKDISTISACCCTYLKLVIFIDMHAHMVHACTYTRILCKYNHRFRLCLNVT
jgi:hypothetical protein